MATYVALATLKSSMGIGDTNDDALLNLALDAATRQIDEWCGRKFVGETGVTKYLRASSATSLTVPDLRVVTGVTVDVADNRTFSRVLTENTDYELLPYQSYPDSGIYTELRVLTHAANSFYGPGALVKVIGDWGYVVSGAAPKDIEAACMIQASRLYRRKDAPFGVLQTVDLGQFTRISKFDPDVEALLKPYRAMTQSPSWAMV